MRWWARRCWRRPGCHAAIAFAIRWCGVRCMTRPPRSWRLGAHARAARALEEHGGSLTARAHHLERCAQPGDARRDRRPRRGGRDGRARARRRRRRPGMRAALRLLPEGAETAGQRLGLLVGAGPVSGRDRRADGGAAGMAAALDLAAADDGLGALRARLVAGCAMCENLLGRARRRPTAGSSPPSMMSPIRGRPLPRTSRSSWPPTRSTTATSRRMHTWAQRGLDGAIALGEPALAVVAESLVCFARARARPDRRGAGGGGRGERAAGRARRRRDRGAARRAVLPRVRRVFRRALRGRDPSSAPRDRRVARVGAGAVRDADGDRPRARLRGDRPPARGPRPGRGRRRGRAAVGQPARSCAGR